MENAPVISCLVQDLFVTLTKLKLRPFYTMWHSEWVAQRPSVGPVGEFHPKWPAGNIRRVTVTEQASAICQHWQTRKTGDHWNTQVTPSLIPGDPWLRKPYFHKWKRQSYLWQTQRCHWLGRREGHWHSCLECCWCRRGSGGLQPDWRWY